MILYFKEVRGEFLNYCELIRHHQSVSGIFASRNSFLMLEYINIVCGIVSLSSYVVI